YFPAARRERLTTRFELTGHVGGSGRPGWAEAHAIGLGVNRSKCAQTAKNPTGPEQKFKKRFYRSEKQVRRAAVVSQIFGRTRTRRAPACREIGAREKPINCTMKTDTES